MCTKKQPDKSFCPRVWIKKANPYKACIYWLCSGFLDGNGYDLGTKILIFWRKMLSRRSLSIIQQRFRIFYVKDTNYFCIKLTTLANDLWVLLSSAKSTSSIIESIDCINLSLLKSATSGINQSSIRLSIIARL